jgi:hypothetical protein
VAVREIIKRTATGHKIFFKGTMVSSSQGDEWTLPNGRAAFWCSDGPRCKPGQMRTLTNQVVSDIERLTVQRP